jgi:hypothetical protein
VLEPIVVVDGTVIMLVEGSSTILHGAADPQAVTSVCNVGEEKADECISVATGIKVEPDPV